MLLLHEEIEPLKSPEAGSVFLKVPSEVFLQPHHGYATFMMEGQLKTISKLTRLGKLDPKDPESFKR
ncbi:MAG: hypothetical protein AAGC68_02730, partial [Verrucomicrobiota bacterium]